ncbi:hypothetical protein RDI58_008045 [Solanum bulbocastanum]|uniref:Aminotransferase-like plant mobile domain-containing protein n=1 Tax=Solanum bulbocastanum TaxID=147425 RepID=A0AAN8YJF8_SOLBU
MVDLRNLLLSLHLIPFSFFPGLYGVYRSNLPIIDRSLITSLVERWRPETHTFHFRTCEATITLQDVEVLYGLPVNSDPILGDESIRIIGDWQNICQRLLGFIPRPQDFNRSSLKVTALNVHMLKQLQLPDLATQDLINQMAICYMFWMIVDMMMTDTSGNYLKLMYLPMLEDLNVVNSYSWGSATLACLYHFLCKASQSNQNEIAGFLTLLQIWAWERVIVLRPQVIAQRDIENNFLAGLPKDPRATRWSAHFSWTDTTKHVLKVFRDVLDSMTKDQVRCYTVHEVARINVQADHRRDEVHDDHLYPPVRRRGKGGVAGRMARAVEKGRAPIEMGTNQSPKMIIQLLILVPFQRAKLRSSLPGIKYDISTNKY